VENETEKICLCDGGEDVLSSEYPVWEIEPG
jgi:hypothetical protein